jgi:AcrR family transcriptional regulator
MESTSSYRESNRVRLRTTLVTATRDLTITRGWDAVRMVDVAKAAGVSRQTVYNEFSGRGGLAEALANAEVERFVAAVREDFFAAGGDPRAASHRAILHTLVEAGQNPLIRAILTSSRGGADELLPYLTTRSEHLLAAASKVIREWAAEHLPHTDAEVVGHAADSLVRLTVSHLVLPQASPQSTAATLAEVFVRLLR